MGGNGAGPFFLYMYIKGEKHMPYTRIGCISTMILMMIYS